MKAIAFAVLLTLFFVFPSRNGRGDVAVAESQQSSASGLERMIRQAWDDFKNKKEKEFASVLADDVVEVEADGRGPRDKAATIADMHTMQIENYSLSDFKFQSLGSRSTLATYRATVDLMAEGQKIHAGLAIAEVWVKRNGQWKLLHYQETEVK